ncbi:MAG: hypothetical protein PWR27_1845 [Petroclostridium sp.]|nr:hypothetical protein [Petroclostridium sp.]
MFVLQISFYSSYEEGKREVITETIALNGSFYSSYEEGKPLLYLDL